MATEPPSGVRFDGAAALQTLPAGMAVFTDPSH